MAYKDPKKRKAWYRRWAKRNPELVAAQKSRSYKKHRKKNLDRSADAHLRRRYGLTPDSYAAMSAAQGGVCKICEKSPSGSTKTGRPVRLYVDHDHRTGAVRGLLCRNCNTILGQADDRPDVLRAAILYLESSRG